MAKTRRKSVVCKNCNYRFDGIDNYCPNCGQENHSHHAPFRHLFLELIEGLTHFDTKFFSTAKSLVIHPGLLTKDYIEDRRARSVPPLRLYVFSSFVFFFLLSLITSHEPIKIQNEQPSKAKFHITQDFSTTEDSILNELQSRTIITEKSIDSLIELRDTESGWLRKLMYKQTLKLNLGLVSSDKLLHSLIKNIGIAVFILMPIFALLLMLLYVRRKRLYIEHLIFSIHFHSFIFASLSLLALLLHFTEWSWVIAVFLIGMPVYCSFAMKRVYENSWGKTLAKAFILFPAYGICIFIIFLITAFASFAIA